MSTVTLSDGVEIRLGNEAQDISPFVKRFLWVESMIRGGFFWEISFVANAWGEWTEVLLGKDKPDVAFRLKSQEEGEEVSTEWRRALTDGSSMSFKGEALIASARGGDRRLDLRQDHKTRVWENLTVTQVVAAVAAEYDLTPRADQAAVVATWLQVQETDWEFLQRIVYESASESGRGDLFLWVDENVLNMRAPVLQVASARRHDMSVVENRVDKLIVSYLGREVDRQGGATVRAVGFDFLTKTAITFDLDSAQAQTHPALSDRVPRDQNKSVRLMPVPEDHPGGVEGNARGRWGRFAPRYFALRVNTRPDLLLRPGTLLEMQATLGENQETPFLGRFLVAEVQHLYERGSTITTAVCYRREAAEGEIQATGSDAANVRTRDNYRFGLKPNTRTIVTAEEIG